MIGQIVSLAVGIGPVGIGIIAVQLLLTILALRALSLCFKYYSDQLSALRELAAQAHTLRSESSEQLNALIDDYSAQLVSNPRGPSIPALVNKHIGNEQGLNRLQSGAIGCLTVRPAFIKFVAASLIGLGLLGTFIGFTLSLGQVQHSLSRIRSNYSIEAENIGNIDSVAVSTEEGATSVVDKLLDSIGKPLEGMNTAFATSVVGLMASLVLSLVQAIWLNYGAVRQSLMYELDAFLNSEYLRRIRHDDEANMPAFMRNLQVATTKIAQSMAEHVDSGFLKVGNELYKITSSIEALLSHMPTLVSSFDDSARLIKDTAVQFGKWTKTTNESLDNLRQLIDKSTAQSDRLVSSVAGLIVPIQKFTETAELSVEYMDGLEDVVQDVGKEILQVLSSSVADFHETVKSADKAMYELMAATTILPDAVMTSSSDAIAKSLKPAIESLMSEARSTQEVVNEAWRVLRRYEAAVPKIGEIAGEAFGANMGDAIAAAFDKIEVEYNTATRKMVEASKVLGAEVVKPIAQELAGMTTAVKLIGESNKQLMGRLSRVFALDDRRLDAPSGMQQAAPTADEA